MGRYYTGDIEGKFWFAIQSSDAADRFGVTGCEPSSIEYWFSEEDLGAVEAELATIKDTIGDENMKAIDYFFDTTNSYNDTIMEENGLSVELWNTHSSDYADYRLGIKIRDCIKESGQCSFNAEL